MCKIPPQFTWKDTGIQDITAVWTADPGMQCQDVAKLRHTHTTKELTST